MENDDGVEGIKDCFVKEMSVRIGERAREKKKAPLAIFAFPPVRYYMLAAAVKQNPISFR